MSHQVNYYLGPADVKELERRLRTIHPLTIIHLRAPTSKPNIVQSLEVIEDGKPWLFLALSRSDDVTKVVLREVPSQGHWVVDEERSPVIQFNNCFFDGSILRRGRLYYVDGFWAPNGTWVAKSEAFRIWAKSVLATTKKMLTKHGRDYIGPDAQNWLATTSGGKLVQ